MKITVLGSGSSGGVPLIGNKWGQCDPLNPHNRRRRCSILLEQGGGLLEQEGGKEQGAMTRLLIDTSPDMRDQLLDIDLQDLTAVLFTHAHADHCHGIDGLRSINWLTGKPVSIYADDVTMTELQRRFDYIFAPRDPAKKFYKPSLAPHVFTCGQAFEIDPFSIMPIAQTHGDMGSVGYRFGNFAYSTDVNFLDDKAFELLQGIKYWIVDCARERPHPTHAHLDLTLSWIERLHPEKAWLTHMDQTMDEEALCRKLPPGVAPAYDGLVITC